VEAIADQNETCRGRVALLPGHFCMAVLVTVAVLVVHFAHFDMAMPPQHKLLEQEEDQDAD
jgi:hypothetical protein